MIDPTFGATVGDGEVLSTEDYSFSGEGVTVPSRLHIYDM
jgi:hypothetical protein